MVVMFGSLSLEKTLSEVKAENETPFSGFHYAYFDNFNIILVEICHIIFAD